MVKLSVAVCHVPHVDPKRDSLVRRLRKQYPDLSVIRDIDREGCWPTSLKATRAISPGATHHMVLHDHAYIPNPDALMAAIEARPDSWISPYCSRKDVLSIPGSWAKIQGTWGTASVAPVRLWDEYRKWALAWTMQSGTDHDDRRVVAWMLATGRAAWMPIPNLVTHTGVKSLLGHSSSGKGSQNLIGSDAVFIADDGSGAKLLRTTPTEEVIKNVDPDKRDLWRRSMAQANERGIHL